MCAGTILCLLRSKWMNQFKQITGLAILLCASQAAAHSDPDTELFVASYGVDGGDCQDAGASALDPILSGRKAAEIHHAK